MPIEPCDLRTEQRNGNTEQCGIPSGKPEVPHDEVEHDRRDDQRKDHKHVNCANDMRVDWYNAIDRL